MATVAPLDWTKLGRMKQFDEFPVTWAAAGGGPADRRRAVQRWPLLRTRNESTPGTKCRPPGRPPAAVVSPTPGRILTDQQLCNCFIFRGNRMTHSVLARSKWKISMVSSGRGRCCDDGDVTPVAFSDWSPPIKSSSDGLALFHWSGCCGCCGWYACRWFWSAPFTSSRTGLFLRLSPANSLKFFFCLQIHDKTLNKKNYQIGAINCTFPFSKIPFKKFVQKKKGKTL